ncbi:DinB family protein [Streptomyces californicus]|uniref:DinB family protein n=1 Tax=Streptomyces californicus TaxID=67351 RepID=UPI003724650A
MSSHVAPVTPMTPVTQVPPVPYTGGEKESLHISLDRHRDVVLWKLEGLDDEQLRRPMTPTGTNLLGLVKHLATVEYGWFCAAFGRPTETFWFDPATEDMAVGQDETTADILAFHARARAAADAAIRETDLETTGTAWDGRVVSMRWVLIHMLEDLLRHAGHMDIVRELIDGATGSYPAPA